MTQAAKAQEPSMEEILASIRRIIADDDAGKPVKAPEAAAPAKPSVVPEANRPAPSAAPAKPATPPPAAAAPVAPAPSVTNSQHDIDAMLAELDGSPRAVAKPMTPQPAAPVKSAADVLDLNEAMAAPPPPKPAPSFRTIDGSSDLAFSNRPEPPPDHALISNATIAAVDSAFNTLAHTVLGQNARTLEDLVKEMLRPMLKSWLDDNLPGMVERIVRAEIERVSRGRP
jgi:cell pole-organizing protein PopZ